MTLQTQGLLAGRGDTPLGDSCPIDRTLQLLGNRVSLLLLREAFYGATRFEQLWRRVGVTEATAAQRLRELVNGGVLERRPYRSPGARTRHEYVLTPAGHDLMPVILGMFDWGAHHIGRDGSPTATHAECGAEVHAVPRCSQGHDVTESELVIS